MKYLSSYLRSYGWQWVNYEDDADTRVVNKFWDLQARDQKEADKLNGERLTREIEASKRSPQF